MTSTNIRLTVFDTHTGVIKFTLQGDVTIQRLLKGVPSPYEPGFNEV